ncbi:hypothetical protein VP1G_09805 [Cytospora mali]|uniref:Xylanolytic transcriptional activator regulatory domain-containing protein n=1 Tax=Cytospora mali TaxID=578113 RepID=A0A194VFQ7_CYTMA|nr:hypothetical protein VP1G_09805 [Valsa mali var. pyri (nom. inval.)]
MDHPQSRPHRDSARPPIKYNPVPIGGPDRPPVTQSPSPDRARSSVATRRSSTAYPDGNNEDNRSEDADGEPQKKRQKRNKPTLSCFECVERKTKTECKYAHVANLLEETSRSVSNGRRMTKPPKKKLGPSGQTRSPIPNIADRGVLSTNNYLSRAAVALSTGLLSTVPYSMGTGSNLFGIGSAHPFANIWTSNGRLEEVIGIMPNKLQCDILVSRYFECVDPIYPVLDQQTFYEDYEHFWSLPLERRYQSDAAFVALINVILALGTQFHRIPATPHEASGAAELHASASNQALRMSSYLSSASIRSIQTMVLMVYFLINDNHASDGWAFAGILMRQAYAMGLHRDPIIVTPDATAFQKQERRKLWQAVLLQDTFLTVLLSLPPNATHTDVNVDDLIDEPTGYTSINNNHDSSHSNSSTDMAYIRGSWTLANLVQESICSPRCLDLPICATPRHKTKLVADFRAVYRAFPDIFRSWDADSLAALAQTNNRVARQTLFLTSNYFHNLMLVHASESPEVPVNVRGSLEAAHDAINAFFMMYALFEHDARTWWVFNHRAFLEALCIGSVLRETAMEPGGADVLTKDQLFVRGRDDIARMVQIMDRMGEGDSGSEVARTRARVLSEFLC